MKSKTSYFNKTIFKKNITHFWPIWLIILIWNLFIMPFMIYNSSFSYRSMDMASQEIEQMRINDIISISYAYANPVVLFIFSTVAVMAVFSYLYNARSANTIHALPVTRKSLFLTNYISSGSGSHRIFNGNFSRRALRIYQHEPSFNGSFVCGGKQFYQL